MILRPVRPASPWKRKTINKQNFNKSINSLTYHGSTINEQPAGIDVENSVGIHIFGGYDGLDDVLHYISADFFQWSFGQVLRRDNNSVHTQGNASSIVEIVLTSNLLSGSINKES